MIECFIDFFKDGFGSWESFGKVFVYVNELVVLIWEDKCEIVYICFLMLIWCLFKLFC